jgi:rubredoxin
VTEIIRRLYPSYVVCPACGVYGARKRGGNRDGEARRCQCGACGHTFWLMPLGHEVRDDSGRVRIVTLRVYG